MFKTSKQKIIIGALLTTLVGASTCFAGGCPFPCADSKPVAITSSISIKGDETTINISGDANQVCDKAIHYKREAVKAGELLFVKYEHNLNTDHACVTLSKAKNNRNSYEGYISILIFKGDSKSVDDKIDNYESRGYELLELSKYGSMAEATLGKKIE